MVFHQGGLSLEWSLIRVVSHQGGHSSGWSFIRVVIYQGGLAHGIQISSKTCVIVFLVLRSEIVDRI